MGDLLAGTCSETTCTILPRVNDAEQRAVSLHVGTLLQALGGNAGPAIAKQQLLTSLGFAEGKASPLNEAQRMEYGGQVVGLLDGSGARIGDKTVKADPMQRWVLEGQLRSLLLDRRPEVQDVARSILGSAGIDSDQPEALPPPRALIKAPPTPHKPTP